MRIHLLKPHDINPPHWYGVSRYATEMVAAMKRQEPSVEFLAFHASLRGRVPQERRGALRHAGVELRPARLPNLSRWTAYNRLFERWFLPGLVARAGCDLSWGTNCVALPKRRRAYRTVVTIHDLFLLTHPELSESHFADVVGPRLFRTAHEVDLILTDSQFTRAQIVERLGVDEGKVVVTTLGVGTALRRSKGEPGDTTKSASGPTGDAPHREALGQQLSPFLLSVGTVEPRKNYQRGLEAYRLLEQRMPQVPPWLIVGRDGWKFEGFYAARERLGLEGKVRVLGEVDDEQLAALYRRAACLFCPSLVEGFGLAVAEAMHAGTPVVCSTGGALPEVGGDAVLAIEPTDCEAMVDALARVLSDPELAAELVRRGRLRAQEFTWKRGARDALAAFHQLLGGSD
jgi:glycosyltransferase involved in cell wall biosynthesis